jgi:hypothetical protein
MTRVDKMGNVIVCFVDECCEWVPGNTGALGATITEWPRLTSGDFGDPVSWAATVAYGRPRPGFSWVAVSKTQLLNGGWVRLVTRIVTC